jgi:hypothetical protein
MQDERENASHVTCWRCRVEAEYRELPGLNLTRAQMRRLWGLCPEACDTIIELLVAAKVLRQAADGSYVAFTSEH